jgi:hypothetical protein
MMPQLLTERRPAENRPSGRRIREDGPRRLRARRPWAGPARPGPPADRAASVPRPDICAANTAGRDRRPRAHRAGCWQTTAHGCQFPEMRRLGDRRKDFPLTRRLPRQVTRRILICLQAFPVHCTRATLDLLARLSAHTRNESPHYGKCLLIKAEAVALKQLQESGPTSLRISGN